MIETLTEPLGGTDPDEWDRLADAQFYASAAWLSLCGHLRGAPVGAVIAHLEDGDTVAVPAVTTPPPLRPSYDWSQLLREAGLAGSEPAPLRLLLGPPEGYRCVLLASQDADPNRTAATIVRRVGELVGDLAPTGAARECVAMYVPTVDAGALLEGGAARTPVLLDFEAWIDVPEGGWEGWLASLAPKRRSEVRREGRRFNDADLRVVHRPLLDGFEDLVPLAVATDVKHGSDANAPRVRQYFEAFSAALGPAARVAVAQQSKQAPVAFCVYVLHQGTAYLRWAGFDYDRVAGSAAYFNVCYYAVLQHATELGVHRLHAGTKASAAKALRGARLEPLWLVDVLGRTLIADDAAIRRHNAELAGTVLNDPRTRSAVAHLPDWAAPS